MGVDSELNNWGPAKSFPQISSCFPWLQSFPSSGKGVDEGYIVIARFLLVA